MNYPRRQQRAMNLTAHVMSIIKDRLPPYTLYDISKELNELFYSAGVEVITEADRIQAGLAPRDHNGFTLQELAILENKRLQAMLEPIRIDVK